MSKHSNFILITFFLGFLVIMLGAYTRLTNAGLSCPDWPHCFGFITAPHTPQQLHIANLDYPSLAVNTTKAWTEMTHRYVAGTEGLLILALSLSLLFTRSNIKSACILLSLLGLQIILGMLTVTEKLKPMIVLSHLLTGIFIISLLWWVYLNTRSNQRTTLTWFFGLGILLLSIQIALGGWVSTHYASLACIDFPFCNGQLLPTLQWHQLNTDVITIHMLHRIGALITAIYLFVFSIMLIKLPAWRNIAVLILVFLFIQLTLGVLNILWLRPVWLALCHQAVAIFLLLTLITGLSR